MKNKNLRNARRNKNDEFYTLLPDIENELKWYKDHFKNKVVYCNCDDVDESNFVRFFEAKFEDYGLKKLIATGYQEGTLTTQMYEKTSEHTKITTIHGNGSYSSPACLELLQETDIVVTNPPFSLFREYITTLIEAKKEFLIIGNNNAITYKEVFPLIRNNKVWLGVSPRSMTFSLPDNSKVQVNACWFTNLNHHKRNSPIVLYKQYSPQEYPHYDNYNAINVSKVKEIPMNYDGAMGVPITFLDKYCPSQFTIEDANEYVTSDSVPVKVHGLIKDNHSAINGKPVYARIVIKHRELTNEN